MSAKFSIERRVVVENVQFLLIKTAPLGTKSGTIQVENKNRPVVTMWQKWRHFSSLERFRIELEYGEDHGVGWPVEYWQPRQFLHQWGGVLRRPIPVVSKYKNYSNCLAWLVPMWCHCCWYLLYFISGDGCAGVCHGICGLGGLDVPTLGRSMLHMIRRYPC